MRANKTQHLLGRQVNQYVYKHISKHKPHTYTFLPLILIHKHDAKRIEQKLIKQHQTHLNTNTTFPTHTLGASPIHNHEHYQHLAQLLTQPTQHTTTITITPTRTQTIHEQAITFITHITHNKHTKSLQQYFMHFSLHFWIHVFRTVQKLHTTRTIKQVRRFILTTPTTSTHKRYPAESHSTSSSTTAPTST